MITIDRDEEEELFATEINYLSYLTIKKWYMK